MTLETFFEKFELFAAAPDAVAKMRELVLQLAVQGKLVNQNPKDEPASELIKRAVLAGKPKRLQVALAELEERAVTLTELPAGWAWTCCDILGETSPRVSASDEDLVGFAPMQRIPTDYREQLVPEVRPWGDIKKGYTHFADGDIAFAKITPCFQNGKACVFANLPRGVGAGTTELHVLRPHPETVVTTYMLLFFKTPNFISGGVKSFSGTAGQQRVSNDFFRFWPVPLPPLAEQKRIVAKVDELMALCDRLEAQQQEREARHAILARASLARFAAEPTTENLQFLFHPSYNIPPADLRKSILTLAVQGKLVRQDPNDEPAEKCLSRLGLRSTFIPPEGDDNENDDLPPAWARVRFEDIAIVAGGVTLGRKLRDRTTVSLPYLRVANVKRGEINLSVIKEVCVAEDEVERYALRANDLLMTEGGDWDKVGRAAIWNAEIPVCLHQNHVFRARMRSAELVPFWFERYFNSAVGRGYFESASKQTTNLASINMRQVRNCPIPLPPLAEQRRIVAKVEQLMALVDELETQLAASREIAANLLAAVVAEITGTPTSGVKASPGTGRRGRPSKS